MKKGMDIAKEKIIEFLEEIKTPIETKEQLMAIGNVSTNYD